MSRVNVLLVVHFNSSKCSSVRCFWFYLHLVCICLAMYLNVESVIVRIERKRDKKKGQGKHIVTHLQLQKDHAASFLSDIVT